jgi:hypothetical protein
LTAPIPKGLFGILCAATLLVIGCGENNSTQRELDRRIRMGRDTIYPVSSFIHDADDPVNLHGIDFELSPDILSAPDIHITATSNNQLVVPDKNLAVSGEGSVRNLRIKAIASGYATINVIMTGGPVRRTYVLNYAASQTNSTNSRRWHTGISDASAAVIVDENHMLVANDETNFFYLYHRNHSGIPVKTFDFNPGNNLALTDSFAGVWKEVDVEAAVQSPLDNALVYWLGSMSNNSSFLDRPNRNRLFAVTLSGNGSAAQLKNAGSYAGLKQQLLSWGDAHGYDFTKSAAVGQNPKVTDGFNIEGMVFGPDNSTLYIGFRSPLVPASQRSHAIIAPITHFEKWFNRGSPGGQPVIGNPIELNLSGRGIRDIIRLANDTYIIVAGSCGGELVPAIYSWSGHAADAPVLINSFAINGMNIEAVLPVYEGGQLSLSKLQVLLDNGNDIFYGDTILAKDLPWDNHKKFCSVISSSSQNIIAPLSVPAKTVTSGN